MKTVKKLLFLAALTAGTTAPAYAAQYAHYGRKAADSASLFAKISLISGAYAWGLANLLESIPTSEDYFKKRHSLTCPPPLVEDFVREIAKREQVENPGKVKVYTNPDTGSTASAARPDAYSQYIFLDKSVADDLSWTLSNQNDEAMQSNLSGHRATITHEAAHLKHNHQKKSAALALFSSAFFINSSILSLTRLFAGPSGTACIGQLIRSAMHLEFWHLVNKAYWRLLEFEADDAITRPDEIRADMEFYKRHWSGKPPKEPLELLKYTVESLHSTHPHHYERIERFEKRLQESEENN